jgi:phosphoribosyl-AMP cyclohydrolase
VVLLAIEQVGGIACHTGRRVASSTNYKPTTLGAGDPVLKDPKEIYAK